MEFFMENDSDNIFVIQCSGLCVQMQLIIEFVQEKNCRTVRFVCFLKSVQHETNISVNLICFFFVKKFKKLSKKKQEKKRNLRNKKVFPI